MLNLDETLTLLPISYLDTARSYEHLRRDRAPFRGEIIGSRGDFMGYRGTLNLLRAPEHGLDDRTIGPTPTLLANRTECLEQLLQAFRDIADHDDIHQAAHRLVLVQAWIDNEAERAAADPIFADLQLV